MAIEFVNPLTAGTVLVRSDIRSQNYNPGSAGWIIEADGDAEFNDVTIRGGTTIGGDILLYDGTPGATTLSISISAGGGTDEFGNTYPDGIAVFDAATNEVRQQIIPENDPLYGGGFWTVAAEPFDGRTPVYNQLTGGALFFNQTTAVAHDGHVLWFQEEPSIDNYTELNLSSGGPDDAVQAAQLVVRSASDANPIPFVSVESNTPSCDLFVSGSTYSGNMAWGNATTPAPGAGGGTTTVSVAFGKTFPNTPRVMVQCRSTVDPGTVTINWVTDNITTTGFDIRAYRSTNSGSSFDWFAVSN